MASGHMDRMAYVVSSATGDQCSASLCPPLRHSICGGYQLPGKDGGPAAELEGSGYNARVGVRLRAYVNGILVCTLNWDGILAKATCE